MGAVKIASWSRELHQLRRKLRSGLTRRCWMSGPYSTIRHIMKQHINDPLLWSSIGQEASLTQRRHLLRRVLFVSENLAKTADRDRRRSLVGFRAELERHGSMLSRPHGM